MFTIVFSNGGKLVVEARSCGEAIKVAKVVATQKHTTVKSVTQA